jgi:hypothetical protein
MRHATPSSIITHPSTFILYLSPPSFTFFHFPSSFLWRQDFQLNPRPFCTPAHFSTKKTPWNSWFHNFAFLRSPAVRPISLTHFVWPGSCFYFSAALYWKQRQHSDSSGMQIYVVYFKNNIFIQYSNIESIFFISRIFFACQKTMSTYFCREYIGFHMNVF